VLKTLIKVKDKRQCGHSIPPFTGIECSQHYVSTFCCLHVWFNVHSRVDASIYEER